MKPPLTIDIIGDIHGELAALESLAKELGYDRNFHHPEGRIPLFLGDLVDRGAHSLEVVERVMGLVHEGRGACIMGNHEYNLVAHWLKLTGYEKPKRSNRATVESMAAAPGRWEAALAFLRELPMAFVFPELRVIHACWHVQSYEEVKPVLEVRGASAAGGALAPFVALSSPFTDRGLKPGLKAWDASRPKEDSAVELLLKGFEVPAEAPFLDTEGVERDMKRATWWLKQDGKVLRDRPQVVGHYWNLPPVGATFCPPHPSGHPKLKAWRNELLPNVPAAGRVPWTTDIACVDFNGVTAGSKDGRACVGALRWPEREIVWASAPRTRSVGVHDE